MYTSAWNDASNALKQNAASMPRDQKRTIRKIIGETLWTPLQWPTRHRLGKHVRAHLDAYGLVHAGKKGSIAAYVKA